LRSRDDDGIVVVGGGQRLGRIGERYMGSVEERLSSLEARVDAHAAGLNDLRQAVVHLEQRLDRRFEAIDRAVQHSSPVPACGS